MFAVNINSKRGSDASDLSAAMFFGRIDLYSVHWVHEANRNLVSSRCYSDVAIVHHSRFCKANRNMVPGSPARNKIRDVTQWSLYKSILPKNMAASKSDITSAVLNWYWPRTFLHTFATKLSIAGCFISPARREVYHVAAWGCQPTKIEIVVQNIIILSTVMCYYVGVCTQNTVPCCCIVYYKANLRAGQQMSSSEATLWASLSLCPSLQTWEFCKKRGNYLRMVQNWYHSHP